LYKILHQGRQWWFMVSRNCPRARHRRPKLGDSAAPAGLRNPSRSGV